MPARRPEPPRGRFPWWLAAAAVVVVAGLAIHYRDTLAGPLRPSPPTAVRTVLVRSGPLEQTIRLTGTTAAEHSVFLRAPYLRGRRSRGAGDFQLVLQELTDSGRQVRKGEAVAPSSPGHA
ncbi:MAG: hypothetical protein FJW34_12390 [Acidobacteria bacterium]|nr:hypothetical protein [Acidobacteriota bacterium]